MKAYSSWRSGDGKWLTGPSSNGIDWVADSDHLPEAFGIVEAVSYKGRPRTAKA
jgi:hypothetical protein